MCGVDSLTASVSEICVVCDFSQAGLTKLA